LSQHKLLVIDTETGGFNPESHSILSLAALVYEDGKIVSEFYTLICEGHVIVSEDAALKVNGLSLERLRANGVSPYDAWVTLTNMLTMHWPASSKIILAGHNVAFDIGFLKRLYRLACHDYSLRFSHRSLCTQSGALLLEQAGLLELPGGSSLEGVAKALGVPLDREGGHNALKDARATAQVLARMVEGIR